MIITKETCPLGFVSSPLTKAKEVWRQELQDDPDFNFILSGVTDGFHITDIGSQFKPVECNNYRSATVEYRDEVEVQLREEIALGNYVITDQKPTIVSSLGAIPKSSGGVRLIHDGSRPLGANMNNYVTNTKFKYDTVDNATSLIPERGWVSKIDLRHAYRSVPVHCDCYPATGLKWTFIGDNKPTYLYDARLPFGASKSCFIFSQLSAAVTRMMHKRGFTVISYLDDYLTISDSYENCKQAHDCLIQLLQQLGFTINWEKVVPPTQSLTFLGIQINCYDRTLSLDSTRIAELRTMLRSYVGKHKVTKRQLQHLVGKLSWAARVIQGGRTHLRRLIDLTCKLKLKHHRTRLTVSARNDISWWTHCMDIFNGTACFICDTPVPSSSFSTDACMSAGAAFYCGDWFYANWAIDHPDKLDSHINYLECFTILLAAYRWHHLWRNKHIKVYSDNKTTISAINLGTSRSRPIMALIRELFWLSVTSNFRLSATWVPGVCHESADTLSRLHEPKQWLPATAIIGTYNAIDNSYIIDGYGHMSYTTFCLLQDLFRSNGDPCLRKLVNTNKPIMQRQLNLPTGHA